MLILPIQELSNTCKSLLWSRIGIYSSFCTPFPSCYFSNHVSFSCYISCYDYAIFPTITITKVTKSRLIDENKHHILKAAHPSGLSAHRGFFGCRHFSRANQYIHGCYSPTGAHHLFDYSVPTEIGRQRGSLP